MLVDDQHERLVVCEECREVLVKHFVIRVVTAVFPAASSVGEVRGQQPPVFVTLPDGDEWSDDFVSDSVPLLEKVFPEHSRVPQMISTEICVFVFREEIESHFHNRRSLGRCKVVVVGNHVFPFERPEWGRVCIW